MKNFRKDPGQLKKVRPKATSEVYYTYSQWDTKDIDGVTFLAVVKEKPSNKLQQIHYMRKDNMEFIK